MTTIGLVICPHLRGSNEGTLCCVTHNLIKNMEGYSIKLCMGRRHEACSVYKQSLRSILAHCAY
jgi:hypothetical protein